ncbi:HEAT repeat domain-containing protein [Streptomyces sp. NPDC059575]|uniref:HEAT repeat domain-containing protein n=1 Tax=Streptomyces sp. NPDC059575 TaxID=3346872 RepID=UPI00368885F2
MTAATNEQAAERSALRYALSELDARLADATLRGPGAYLRFEAWVEQLRTPAAAFLRPDLERRLARHVDADDSFARDRIAHVLAGACGAAALPALLRARESDRNDEGDTLELTLLDLFSAWPEESIRLVLDCLDSADPRTRRVGIWGVAVIDFGGARFFGLVADAASDPDPQVRAGAMSTLGSVFGVGDPPRALAVLLTGARDPAPEVRRSAVSALGRSREEAVTDLLVACAEDTDRWVRFWTAWSLARRPGPTVRATLERLAADEDGDVRDAVRTVMGLPVAPG